MSREFLWMITVQVPGKLLAYDLIQFHGSVMCTLETTTKDILERAIDSVENYLQGKGYTQIEGKAKNYVIIFWSLQPMKVEEI